MRSAGPWFGLMVLGLCAALATAPGPDALDTHRADRPEIRLTGEAGGGQRLALAWAMQRFR